MLQHTWWFESTTPHMKKLIDLDESTFKTLSHMAIESNTNLKKYIESILINHAGGGFKDKKPTPNSIKKR
jgi:hypothetical protein